ncbi:MAG: hypothetical protein C4K47_09020 [Candidatus Thorarchaeota archaeon]|nr:MAG: hypothetical protein C4K47_09020 [Candidatus Thorarchaeota archaeon]
MGNVTLDVCRGNEKGSIEVPDESVYLGAQGLTSIDLRPLSESGKLQNLWLYNNQISSLDLTPLASCSRLRSLSLRDNCLDSLDLVPLQKCARLEDLDLSDNRMTAVDLGPLGSCSNLHRLDISGNSLNRIVLQPLVSCSSLRALTMGQSESGSPESAKPEGGMDMKQGSDSHLAEAVDVSPLFWCDQLSAVTVRGEVGLTLDPALWYIGAAKVFSNTEMVTSALHDKSSPILAWMNKSLFSRLGPLSYEAVVTQTSTQALQTMITGNIRKVSKRYWFHAQKGLLEGFALRELSGYDGNPLSILDLPSCPQEYASLRTALRSHVVELVRKQIAAGGPTLFIDVDALLTDDESTLAEAVVRARREEIDRLSVPTDGHFADISRLIVTSYGHSIVRALGEQRMRIPLMDFEKVLAALRDSGFSIKSDRGKPGRFRLPVAPKVSGSLISFVVESSLDLLPSRPATITNT